MMNTSRVAIYCRLSEEDRNKQSETDDSNSIQNRFRQPSICRKINDFPAI